MASPTTTPTQFCSPAAFDRQIGHVVLYTGASVQANWEWTGSDWVTLRPVLSPPLHLEFGIVYDAAIGNIVMFCGSGPSADHATWWLAFQP
jgi:hypothetical protein